jgi:FkbM family methyltransferase
VTEAFDGSWSNHSTVLPSRLADQFPDWIHIEPRSSFFHFGPNSRDLFTLFEAPGAVPDSAYSIHLWEHLWRDRQRVDFSLIHEGMLDNDYFRGGHTTYAAAALPFLPPAESESTGRAGSNAAARWRRIRLAAAVWARELRLDAEALAGLLAIPLVRLVKPGFGRLHLARARWCYRRARDRFQVENALEDSILRCVILWDEYGLFHLPLIPGDVVIDVGAHFGAFSFACHARGSRNIHAFEPSAALASRLRQHLAGLPGIYMQQKAVFRSDRPLERLRHSGPLNAWNSGSGSVIFGDYAVDASSRGLIRIDGETQRVPAVSLDEILAPFERVHLLKLDCEGSEFPILLTSTQLAKVERIVGEYHELTRGEMVHLAPEALVEGCNEFSFATRRHLEQQGSGRIMILPSTWGSSMRCGDSPETGGVEHVLFLSPAWPRRGGTGLAMRAWAVAEALARKHRVSIVVPRPDGLPPPGALPRNCAAARVSAPVPMREVLRQGLARLAPAFFPGFCRHPRTGRRNPPISTSQPTRSLPGFTYSGSSWHPSPCPTSKRSRPISTSTRVSRGRGTGWPRSTGKMATCGRPVASTVKLASTGTLSGPGFPAFARCW